MYYSYFKSPCGLLKIVADEKYLREISFVNYKAQDILLGNHITDEACKQLSEYFFERRKFFSLDLILEGTEFQKKVWTELREIPYGTTATYKDIATAIGADKAYRAVGNANNKNKIGIVIPCHRVIGSDGSLTGYAGGIEVKRFLIEHEKNNYNMNK